jgi:hypothetical protein
VRIALVLLLSCLACRTDDPQDAASAQEAAWQTPPEKEHAWLQQFVGEWKTRGTMAGAEGQPPLEGREQVRSLGDYWILSEVSGTMPGGGRMSAVMTLGYDPERKRFVGTWIDSVTTHMWQYEGTLDASGKVLTLETEGPDFENPQKTTRFRDVLEFHDKDHKALRSLMQAPDGTWTEFLRTDFTRTR